tara:strand:+ start:130 stop:321 length:192 start_codon:yes stop_codon:yes gene_type:complete
VSVLSVLSVRAKYVYKSMVYGFDFTDKLVTTFVSFVSKKLILCGFLNIVSEIRQKNTLKKVLF